MAQISQTITPEDVKKHIVMFTTVANTMMQWIPGETGEKVRRVGQLIVGLTAQDWFVGLITYLLNTFQDKPINNTDLASALANFSKEVKKGKDLPVKFDIK